MSLTPEEKALRKRARMIEKAEEKELGTCIGIVATVFQKMVRAEAAVHKFPFASAIKDGVLCNVFRRIGECVCVTCGKVGPWKGNSLGGGPIETGHFVPSRRASILFEPTNAHPQCKFCNHRLSGNKRITSSGYSIRTVPRNLIGSGD